MSKKKKWNWQKEDWPNFQYNHKPIAKLEEDFLKKSYLALGTAKAFTQEQRDLLIVELSTNEAYKTSEIEGEYLNRESLQSSIRRQFGLTVDRYRSLPAEEGIAEIIYQNYQGFMSPLSHETLWQWHTLLMKDRRDLESIGAYRTHKEAMQVVSGYIHKPNIHFEAPPSEAMFSEMEAFIKWFNDSQTNDHFKYKPLLRAAITHLWFVYIHPFEDGNGRIGRLLVEKSIWQSLGNPFLMGLSQTIYDNRKDYYNTLEVQNKTNQIDPWITYFSKVLIDAQEYTENKINFIIKKDHFFKENLDKLNERQIKVINKMFAQGPQGFQGGLSSKNYCSITNVSASTATRDLQELVENNVFRREGELKGSRYYLSFLDNN